MENKLITKEIRDKLRKPFPAEAIKKHPTKSFLSTIKAIYITERLNDVFGIGVWRIDHEIISDETNYVAVRGRIILGEPYNFKTSDQYGGHKKTGTNTEPADGYKSAVTDCLSKCASLLEVGIDVFKGKGVIPESKKDKKQSPELPSESTNWWDNEKHWKFRDANEFYNIIQYGFGIKSDKFQPSDSVKQGYNKLKEACPDTKRAIKKKFVTMFSEKTWNNMLKTRQGADVSTIEKP